MGQLSSFTKFLLAIILLLLAFSLKAQTKFYEEWMFFPGTTQPLVFKAKGYQRIVLEPKDTATWEFTITRTRKVWYDTLTSETQYNDSHASIVYSAGWGVGQGLPKFFGNDAHWGTNMPAVRTAVFTVTLTDPSVIKFYSEHFNESWGPHGKYSIKLDNGTPVELDASKAPIGSDKDLGTPSWKTGKLPPGTYKVTITTTAQMVVDAFTVTKYTLKPRL